MFPIANTGGRIMHLTFEHFDGRSLNFVEVIDAETDKRVGHIQTGAVGLDVDLFDGKYTASVNRYDQCWGFVKGVETVLNHMTKAMIGPLDHGTKGADSKAA
jgi:hypothetical protein